MICSRDDEKLNGMVGDSGRLRRVRNDGYSPVLASAVFGRSGLSLPIFRVGLGKRGTCIGIRLVPTRNITPGRDLALGTALGGDGSRFVSGMRIFFCRGSILLNSNRAITNIYRCRCSDSIHKRRVVIIGAGSRLRCSTADAGIVICICCGADVTLGMSPSIVCITSAIIIGTTLLHSSGIPVDKNIIRVCGGSALLGSDVASRRKKYLGCCGTRSLGESCKDSLGFGTIFGGAIRCLPSRSPVMAGAMLLSRPSVGLRCPSTRCGAKSAVPLAFCIASGVNGLLRNVRLIVSVLSARCANIASAGKRFILGCVISSDKSVIIRMDSIRSGCCSSGAVSRAIAIKGLGAIASLADDGDSSDVDFVRSFALSTAMSSKSGRGVGNAIDFCSSSRLLRAMSLANGITGCGCSAARVGRRAFRTMFGRASRCGSSRDDGIVIGVVGSAPLVTMLASSVCSN